MILFQLSTVSDFLEKWANERMCNYDGRNDLLKMMHFLFLVIQPAYDDPMKCKIQEEYPLACVHLTKK